MHTIESIATLLGCDAEHIEKKIADLIRDRDDAVESASNVMSILVGAKSAAQVPERIRTVMHTLAAEIRPRKRSAVLVDIERCLIIGERGVVPFLCPAVEDGGEIEREAKRQASAFAATRYPTSAESELDLVTVWAWGVTTQPLRRGGCNMVEVTA